jgi:uncharacterized membrane protein YeaQ/YmgE (transglycosylase-associated protein family)
MGTHADMDISYILFALLVGLVAGFLARAIMPGKDDMGIVPTIILGLVGSFLGAVLFRAIGIGDEDNFDLGSLLGAVVGALIVLGAYNAITGKKKHDLGHGNRV